MSRYNVTPLPIQRPRPIGAVEKTPVPIEVLHDICRWPRFSGTPGEEYVIKRYIRTLPGVTEDDYGNFWVLIRDGDKPVTTLFSSHTDTVHKRTATQPYKLSCRDNVMTARGGGVLGADDGTGMWIMLNLIKANVPGLYIFHRDEEIGGLGSSHIVSRHADTVTGLDLKHCIAFDRKGTRDVITHQGGTRCCSDAFANALAEAINVDTRFAFCPDDTGSFTDSANYTDLIGECTNLSVGYYDQHSTHESQDLAFVSALVNRLIAIDFSSLPQVRQPGEEDPDALDWRSSDFNGLYSSDYHTNISASLSRDQFEVISELCSTYPGEIADVLMSMGWSSRDLIIELEDTYSCDVGNDLGYSRNRSANDIDYLGLQ